MNRNSLQIHLIISALIVLLQTTLFKFIEIKGVSPDLLLIYLVFAAHSKGVMEGQIIGITSGFIEDILSLAPLGLNSALRLIIGAMVGNTKGKVDLDPIVMPIIFVVIASFIKEILTWILSIFFIDAPLEVFTSSFFIEVGFNLVLTPLIYNLLRKVRVFADNPRDMR